VCDPGLWGSGLEPVVVTFEKVIIFQAALKSEGFFKSAVFISFQ
jgi:hypothetical protein